MVSRKQYWNAVHGRPAPYHAAHLGTGLLRPPGFTDPYRLTPSCADRHDLTMPQRMIAILADEVTRGQVDLVRALYDRAAVEQVPPHVPLAGPFDDRSGLATLSELVGLVVGAHQPFMLALAQAERFFDGDQHLLQIVGGTGADAALSLAAALDRDVIPQHSRDADGREAPQRVALTLGRFEREAEADRAVDALARTSYFLVVTQVGILEERDEGGWSVERSIDLGTLRAGAD